MQTPPAERPRTTNPERRGGRQRSAATEDAILAATRELLAEGGVQKLTIEGVAARAGVAKTTVYRRWRSKDELALAVLIRMVEEFVPVPDLGNTRDEFVAFVNGAVTILSQTMMGPVMKGLVSDIAVDAQLGEAFQAQVVTVRQAEVKRLIERGARRGDLRAGIDHTHLHEMLFGPVYYRLLLSGAPLDGALAERVVSAVLPAFAA
jgi:AcrR family transcriptional regulator